MTAVKKITNKQHRLIFKVMKDRPEEKFTGPFFRSLKKILHIPKGVILKSIRMFSVYLS